MTPTNAPHSAPARALLLSLAIAATLVGAMRAQLAPPTPPAAAAAKAAPRDSDTVTLNPFEVKGDSDSSYGALNSNSITRFNTELDHMPVSADIFNEAFMKDIAATSVEDMVVGYSAGAGSAIA